MSDTLLSVQKIVAPQRAEFVRDAAESSQVPVVVEKPLSALVRLYNQTWLRKVMILIILALIWEAYGRYLNNNLLFPTFSETMSAFFTNIGNGVLPARAWSSIKVLLMCYACGVTLAAILSLLLAPLVRRFRRLGLGQVPSVLGAVSVLLNTAADLVAVMGAAKLHARFLHRPDLFRRLRQGSGILMASLGVGLLAARRA